MAVALVALAVVAGCSGGGEEADGATPSTEWAGDDTTATVGAPDCPPPEVTMPGFEGITECELPDVVYQDDADPTDRVAALAATAREHDLTEVADALADGELTVAERRQAYQNALDCMTEQGMEVFQFEEYEGLYGTEFTYIIGGGALTEDEADVVDTNCEGRYLSQVATAYEILAGGRFTARAKQVLQDCMGEYGVTDDVGDTLDELREVSPGEDATLDCRTRAENKPPPPADLPRPPEG